jgi:hypothetical protein
MNRAGVIFRAERRQVTIVKRLAASLLAGRLWISADVTFVILAQQLKPQQRVK